MGGYRFSDIWSIFQRRFWVLALAVLLIMPVALAVAYFLPAKYQSTATILVESQQISPTLVTSTVIVTAAERLELIQQRLMTRDKLVDLIGKFRLYEERTDLSLTRKVDLVRRNTRFDSIAQPNGGNGVLAFSISFTASTGEVAASVANEFAGKILDENARSRTDRATETLDYIEKEVDRLSGALGAIGAEITAFKNANQKSLPESLDFRRRELAAVQARMFQRDQTRVTLDEQRRTLDEGLRTGQIGLVAGQALSQEEQDLLALRNTLIQRRAVLSETHPEILALNARISALEKVVSTTAGTATSQASIAVQRSRQQLALLERQIALLDEQQRADEAYRAELDASIAATPQVEITLNELLRRQARLQAEFDSTVTKRTLASQGAQLEVNNQGERFELIEPAQVPDRPSSPNRLLIAAGGGVFSVAVGLALVLLVELLNQSIRTAHALEHRTGLQPIVVIPYVQTGRERVAGRVRWTALVILMLGVVPVLLFLVHSVYLPLDVLAERLAERSGLNGLIRIIEIRLGR